MKSVGHTNEGLNSCRRNASSALLCLLNKLKVFKDCEQIFKSREKKETIIASFPVKKAKQKRHWRNAKWQASLRDVLKESRWEKCIRSGTVSYNCIESGSYSHLLSFVEEDESKRLPKKPTVLFPSRLYFHFRFSLKI